MRWDFVPHSTGRRSPRISRADRQRLPRSREPHQSGCRRGRGHVLRTDWPARPRAPTAQSTATGPPTWREGPCVARRRPPVAGTCCSQGRPPTHRWKRWVGARGAVTAGLGRGWLRRPADEDTTVPRRRRPSIVTIGRNSKQADRVGAYRKMAPTQFPAPAPCTHNLADTSAATRHARLRLRVRLASAGADAARHARVDAPGVGAPRTGPPLSPAASVRTSSILMSRGKHEQSPRPRGRGLQWRRCLSAGKGPRLPHDV